MLKFPANREARRRRNPISSVETLETRNLLSYTPLNYALPDLVVTGGGPAVAGYGGTIQVMADVTNIGHSKGVEPMGLEPNGPSTSDAPASVVSVYLSPAGGRNWARRAVKLGDISVPSLPQNTTYNLNATFDMPDSVPARFPDVGGKVFIWFRANGDGSIKEANRHNNVSRATQALQLYSPLPQLALASASYNGSLVPGAVISPTFELGNYGTTDTDAQAPVTVLLVASSDRYYGSSDLVLASYTFANVPALSNVSSFSTTVLERVNIDIPNNVVLSSESAAALPSTPSKYFIGFIVDPYHQIRQISDLDGSRTNALEGLRLVSTANGRNPGTLISVVPLNNVFPTPAFGLITSPFFPNNPTTTLATPASLTVSSSARSVPSARDARATTVGASSGSSAARSTPQLPRTPTRYRVQVSGR